MLCESALLCFAFGLSRRSAASAQTDFYSVGFGQTSVKWKNNQAGHMAQRRWLQCSTSFACADALAGIV